MGLTFGRDADFAGRYREVLRGRADRVGCRADLADDGAEPGDHFVHGAHDQPDFILAVVLQADGQVAIRAFRAGLYRSTLQALWPGPKLWATAMSRNRVWR